jgi:hypothetical protein
MALTVTVEIVQAVPIVQIGSGGIPYGLNVLNDLKGLSLAHAAVRGSKLKPVAK